MREGGSHACSFLLRSLKLNESSSKVPVAHARSIHVPKRARPENESAERKDMHGLAEVASEPFLHINAKATDMI
jgi:hypothetical protein